MNAIATVLSDICKVHGMSEDESNLELATQEIDYLILLLTEEERDIDKEEKDNIYNTDNCFWLQQTHNNKLPEKMTNIRLLPFKDTFIIVGSSNSDNCYIYNKIHNKFKIINLQNKFPLNMKDNDLFNTHFVINITSSNSSKDTNKHYLMFGDNCRQENDSNFMYECIYNINTNSMKFINYRQYVNKNGQIANVNCVALKIRNKTQIIVLDYGDDDNDINVLIYDYIKHYGAKYVIKNNDEQELELIGFIQKPNSNNCIVWGGNVCYELIVSITDDISKYSFKLKKLLWISDKEIEWTSFSYVLYKKFIICFGGFIENVSIRTIYIYDINNNLWHQVNESMYLLPNFNWNTCSIINYNHYYSLIHILGGTRRIGTMDDVIYIRHDTNHWKLYLGYTDTAKKQIWKIFTQKDNGKLLTIQCWKIVYDYIDIGFMSQLLNPYKPYE
eukprot:174011_1